MRQLGSFFLIAMNGLAASDKIFRLLDLSEPAHGGVSCPAATLSAAACAFPTNRSAKFCTALI